MIRRLLILFISYFYAFYSYALADDYNPQNRTWGNISSNATDVAGLMAQFLTSASYVIGIGFLMASLVKYKQYRDNPNQTTLWSPISLLLFGLLLILIPLISSIMADKIWSS